MAPEIVRGEKRPSRETDRYSLSVLLFYLFMVNHPLEGKLEANIKCMDYAARVKLYGTDPVFIFDPDNRTNRPVKGIHDNANIYWPMYPEKMRKMFTKAFTVGLNIPSKRITEPEWMNLFANMMSGMLKCSCGASNFYDEKLEANGAAHVCWHCQQAIPVPVKIVVGKSTVLLNDTTKLLHHHIYGDYDMETVVGSVVQKCDSYARQLEHLMAKRDELRAKNQMKSKEYDEVEHKIKEIRGEIRKEERKYVERAQVIGTTISRATIDPMFEERQFDLVMFDEVSMAYVPQVIAAAALAKEKFMCVGDFRQLAPISQSPDSRVLQVDIFSYLQIVDGKGNMYWHPWLVMLNEQRRMAPAISEFPSKFIYNRLLKDNAEVINGKKKKDNDLVIKSAPLPGDALNLIDLAGTYCAADKNTDGSRFNILSAVISFSTAVKAEQNHIKTVGIITPYAAQVRLIRAMLKDYYTKGTTNVSCATVHQFQGSESDVIVFDAVESYPKSAVGYLMGKEPNQVARLINVAITRGKGKVITVANARFWENVFKGTNHIFYKLLQHIKNGKHQVIDNHDKTLQPYIESVNPGRMINIFMNEQDAISMFEQDMKKAKWQAVVSLPSGELRETEHQVFEILDEADSRGIDIKMKSNDYAKLPEQWKKYCVGTENATFPLIIIDDEVVWYGLPTAKWKFQVDKTTSMITVVHSMVRIKGKNTVEMIKALTDIETVIVGQNIRKLDNKKSKLVTNSFAASSGNSEDNGSILNYGLGAFVEEKEFCPKCKNHMILAKNARGTAYLKCSNKACKETKYLTVDLMNWYINSHNIKCPKRDGGELKGGLGKYGPYVRCNCGHFLKPDEI